MKSYLYNIFVSISQLLNVLTGGNADETLCSRAWRRHLEGAPWAVKFVPIANKIFFWDENHCRESWEVELEQLHQSVQLREALELEHHKHH